jgi:transposase, IS30 family
MKYRQLTFEDRIYIEVLQSEKMKQRDIARLLNVHPSTVCRELTRGMGGLTKSSYRAHFGEGHRRRSNGNRGRKRKLTGDLCQVVTELIRRDWSPEQIKGRLKLERGMSVSHETIYEFIKTNRKQGGDLYLHLRHGKRRRKKRFAVPRVRADILNRRHITERPEVIEKRERFGDWERDLIISRERKEAVLTIVERKTLLTLLRKVESKSPREISRKTFEALGQQICHSLTNDNGFEFRWHEYESEILKVPIYFAAPYASWERGTCENINGLVRQYLPKKTKLKELTDDYLVKIETHLNSRPRKKLGYLTPIEAAKTGQVIPVCKMPSDSERKIALNF